MKGLKWCHRTWFKEGTLPLHPMDLKLNNGQAKIGLIMPTAPRILSKVNQQCLRNSTTQLQRTITVRASFNQVHH